MGPWTTAWRPVHGSTVDRAEGVCAPLIWAVHPGSDGRSSKRAAAGGTGRSGRRLTAAGHRSFAGDAPEHASDHGSSWDKEQKNEELAGILYQGFTVTEMVRAIAGDGEERVAALELGATASGGGRDTEERREASPGVLRHQRSEDQGQKGFGTVKQGGCELITGGNGGDGVGLESEWKKMGKRVQNARNVTRETMDGLYTREG